MGLEDGKTIGLAYPATFLCGYKRSEGCEPMQAPIWILSQYADTLKRTFQNTIPIQRPNLLPHVLTSKACNYSVLGGMIHREHQPSPASFSGDVQSLS